MSTTLTPWVCKPGWLSTLSALWGIGRGPLLTTVKPLGVPRMAALLCAFAGPLLSRGSRTPSTRGGSTPSPSSSFWRGRPPGCVRGTAPTGSCQAGLSGRLPAAACASAATPISCLVWKTRLFVCLAGRHRPTNDSSKGRPPSVVAGADTSSHEQFNITSKNPPKYLLDSTSKVSFELPWMQFRSVNGRCLY